MLLNTLLFLSLIKKIKIVIIFKKRINYLKKKIKLILKIYEVHFNGKTNWRNTYIIW